MASAINTVPYIPSTIQNITETFKVKAVYPSEAIEAAAKNMGYASIFALKEELNIDYALTDYEYLNASVISRNIGYWYNIITIDKGIKNGINKFKIQDNEEDFVRKCSCIGTCTFIMQEGGSSSS